MKTTTKNKILSIVKRLIGYQDPSLQPIKEEEKKIIRLKAEKDIDEFIHLNTRFYLSREQRDEIIQAALVRDLVDRLRCSGFVFFYEKSNTPDQSLKVCAELHVVRNLKHHFKDE